MVATDAQEHCRVGSSSSRWNAAAASPGNLEYWPLTADTYRYV